MKAAIPNWVSYSILFLLDDTKAKLFGNNNRFWLQSLRVTYHHDKTDHQLVFSVNPLKLIISVKMTAYSGISTK